MNITARTLWIAIYRIFERRSVAVGGTLGLRDLMIAWADSGLRETDLAQGLESLVHAGFLRLETNFQGPQARLLDDRFGVLRPAMNDYQVVDWLDRLRQARRRVPGQRDSAAHGRRAEDRVCVAQLA
ncbi:MAG: hypothetical protein ACT4PZ_20700 [Panacagrimonas sp.]